MNATQSLTGAMHRIQQLLRMNDDTNAEPSEALFYGIRWRLTAWYSGVLALVLLLAGLTLYLLVRQSLLGPINQGLRQNAQDLSQRWQGAALRFPDPLLGCSDRFAPPDSLYVCYDVNGRVIGASPIVSELPASFSNPSLVTTAIKTGQAEDTIGTSGVLGTVHRYAVMVPAPDGQSALGVIQVAAPVGTQLQTLDTLLRWLLLIGALGVLCAAFGGLFLANRALLPARLAYRRQRDFIADASHELRTPLTILRSNVEVVLRGRERLPEEDVVLLEDTVREAGHLTAIANTMLDLARLDGEGAHLEAEIVDLVQLADEVTRWAGSLAAEHDLSIRMQGTGTVLLVGDRTLLQQAALILIDNAIKYNRPGGEVTVRVWTDGHQAHLEVRDTGIGIQAQHLPRLGERFFRVDKARSRESGGSGLGLSLVRSIAGRHGGAFHLTSEPGQGTTATLSLPALRTARQP